MLQRHKYVVMAAFAALLAARAGVSQAAAVVNGQTLGGWTITWTAGISVAFSEADNTIDILEKTANFTRNQGVEITFVQNGFSGIAPKIEFDSENVTNSTGSTWSGFEFELINTSVPGAAFEGPAGIFVPPTQGAGVNYSSVSYSSTDIVYSGSQISGSTALWGAAAGAGNGALTIDTHPAISGAPVAFTFKEIPLAVTVVPLPSAVWPALGMLGAMAMFAGLRRVSIK